MYAILNSFIIIWLWATFLVVISCIRLLMKNYQTSNHPNPILHFYNKTVFLRTFLTFVTFVYYPNFSIITNHCINNDQHDDLCHEAKNLDLVSTKSFKKSFVRGVNHVLSKGSWIVQRKHSMWGPKRDRFSKLFNTIELFILL